MPIEVTATLVQFRPAITMGVRAIETDWVAAPVSEAAIVTVALASKISESGGMY